MASIAVESKRAKEDRTKHSNAAAGMCEPFVAAFLVARRAAMLGLHRWLLTTIPYHPCHEADIGFYLRPWVMFLRDLCRTVVLRWI